MRLLLIIVLCIVLPAWSSAQADRDELKAKVEQAFSQMGDWNTPSQIRSHIDEFLTPDYKSHRRVYYDGEKVEDRLSTRTEYLTGLGEQSLTTILPPMSILNFEIQSVELSGKDLGITVSKLDIEYKTNGETISESTEVRFDRWRKVNGTWMAYSSTVDVIMTSLTRATCTYQAFTNNRSSVLLKVFYPAGSMYESDVLEITLVERPEAAYTVETSKGDSFIWKNGRVKNGSGDRPLDFQAENRKQVMEGIIMYYWENQCPAVRSE